jgi:hypothetical protein
VQPRAGSRVCGAGALAAAPGADPDWHHGALQPAVVPPRNSTSHWLPPSLRQFLRTISLTPPMSPLVVLCVVLGLAGLIFLIVKAVQGHRERERQRKAALAQWASATGFSFSERDTWNLDGRYNGVGEIGRGHERYAFEVLSRAEPVPATLFRYHYKTWETRTVRTSGGGTRTERYEQRHWKRYLIVEVGGAFPHFAIRMEGIFDRLAGFVGFDDIDFESEAFSRRFHVKSEDKQFAYALIHPQMMEWLQPQAFKCELIRGLLIADVSGEKHDAENCQQVWAQATGFVNRIPPFVWQDYGKRPEVKLPEPKPYATV